MNEFWKDFTKTTMKIFGITTVIIGSATLAFCWAIAICCN